MRARAFIFPYVDNYPIINGDTQSQVNFSNQFVFRNTSLRACVRVFYTNSPFSRVSKNRTHSKNFTNYRPRLRFATISLSLDGCCESVTVTLVPSLPFVLAPKLSINSPHEDDIHKYPLRDCSIFYQPCLYQQK